MNPLEHVYQDACFQHAEEKKTWTSIEPEAPAQFWGRSRSISPLKSFHLQATDEISYALHQCSFNLRELGTTSRNPIIGVPFLRGNNTFTAWFLFILFLFKEKIKHCGALTFFTSHSKLIILGYSQLSIPKMTAICGFWSLCTLPSNLELCWHLQMPSWIAESTSIQATVLYMRK